MSEPENMDATLPPGAVIGPFNSKDMRLINRKFAEAALQDAIRVSFFCQYGARRAKWYKKLWRIRLLARWARTGYVPRRRFSDPWFNFKTVEVRDPR